MEAPKIKALFDDKLPKICGTYTFMRQPVANSKIHVLRTLFNFIFNDGTRAFGNSDKKCETSAETEQSLISSDMFEYHSTGVGFAKENDTVMEWDGFSMTNLIRTNTSITKIGLTFIEPTLVSADNSDIVPYSGPFVFMPNENNASFYTQIKNDNEVENDEEFSYSIKNISPRSKRSEGSSSSRSRSRSRNRKNKMTIGSTNPFSEHFCNHKPA